MQRRIYLPITTLDRTHALGSISKLVDNTFIISKTFVVSGIFTSTKTSFSVKPSVSTEPLSSSDTSRCVCYVTVHSDETETNMSVKTPNNWLKRHSMINIPENLLSLNHKHQDRKRYQLMNVIFVRSGRGFSFFFSLSLFLSFFADFIRGVFLLSGNRIIDVGRF